VSGWGGTLLALLADDSDFTIAAANLLADRLVDRADPGPDGLQWRMVTGYKQRAPGFSHGTAGVAHALAAAGLRLDRPDLVAVASRGAEALLALGHTPGLGVAAFDTATSSPPGSKGGRGNGSCEE
jgi:hypothetical protein